MVPNRFSLTSFDLSILIHKKQTKNINVYSGNINPRNIIFKYKEGRDFFNHLFKQKTKTPGGISCSRIVKGTEDDLENLLNQAK